jgi:hypothetical protein
MNRLVRDADVPVYFSFGSDRSLVRVVLVTVETACVALAEVTTRVSFGRADAFSAKNAADTIRKD